MPGELTEMLAGDMATVCRELMAEPGPTWVPGTGGTDPAAPTAAGGTPTTAPTGTGMGVPSGSNCSLKPWNWL